ncbi:HEAT repeat domain-containing protein [Kitasatospora sp. NPDC096147]|uniref:HEAT repeat domain-containing protein n=1 Tax=Kitasatospora sp. NPDC096147 TaxID=3364093 RepID=UPI003823275A
MGLPVPGELDQRPRALVEQACERLGRGAVVAWCVALLEQRTAPDDPEQPSLTWIGGRHAAALLRAGGLDRPEQAYWPRVWAARALRYAWLPEAGPAVVRALADPSWRVRETAAKLAAIHELAGAVELLEALTADGAARVRAASVRGLGAVGEGEHAAPIRVALDDPEPAVALAARRALAELCRRLDREL